MYWKLERDFGRLASSTKLQDIIDHGLNVAMTAWHLSDWVWSEPDRRAGLAQRAGVAVSKFNKKDFDRYALEACPNLQYCRTIAISAKHFGYEQRPNEPRFETRVTPVPSVWVLDHGRWVTETGEPIMLTSNAWELRIVDGKTQHRAVEVFAGAVIWWGQFFKNR